MKQGELVYAGKAKSLYRTDVPGQLYVHFRDDITAFDGGKKDVLSRKGNLNARVSAKIFSLLEEHGIPTHFVRMEGDAAMIVRDLRMIPLEVIVRNIAAGSITRNYPVPEGTAFDPPVIVIDYKDDARHDPMLNDDIIVTALRLLSRDQLAEVKALALRVNAVLQRFLAGVGITLVDFKLEFGWDGDRIVVGDEISMDSMRLWDTATGTSLDKDVYRFGKGDVLAVYREVAARALPGGEQK
ncbi:MAG: phosphoribosylaminoimidazolesuccinocarboxamide synthase [Methanomicrobiales archaeon]|nr:phosphoribosylaminoimidazolesuccinocarboxamide synthase [Methanomicrobiales archaeon]